MHIVVHRRVTRRAATARRTPRWFRGFFVVIAATAWLACSAFPKDSPSPAPSVRGALGTQLDQFLSTAADSGFNGVVLVVQNGRFVLHKGYGFADRSRTVPVSVATPFWIVSVSKQFAAAAVLRLVEDGRISLDDPLARFFPQVPAEKRGITLHQLLTHTAGLAGQDAADRVTDREIAVERILSFPLARTPGAGYGYTNDAYTLIAAIVEIVAGTSYELYVRRALLDQAGLVGTGFWGPPAHPGVASILPVAWGDSLLLQPNWGYRGARGMSATAGDLYTWYRALRENRLLSSAYVERLFTQHAVTGSNAGVGYGWFVTPTVRGRPSLWTRGNQGSGHGALLAVFPEDVLVLIIVSNSDRYAPDTPMGHRLGAELLERIFGPDTAAARRVPE